jgi:hypothetical protein
MANITPQGLQYINDAAKYYSQNPPKPQPQPQPETQNKGDKGFLDGLLNNPNLGSLITEGVRTIQGVQNLRQGSSSTDVNPCGKKPFGFGKRHNEKLAKWQECTDSWVASQINKGVPQPYIQETGRNLRPLWIGLAVVTIGIIGVVIYKMKNK